MDKYNIGLIGLAVMGQNLVLNMSDHGYRVAVFNRTTSKVDKFIEGPAASRQILGTYSAKELINALEKPRGEFFHTDWTGEGGDVTSSTYNA